MRTRSWWALACVVLLAGAVAGCKKSKPEPKAGEVIDREGQPAVIQVAEDDPDMKRAIDEARRTVDVFVDRLASPKPDQVYFSVKGRFVDGDRSEHIWLSNVAFRDGAFHGRLGNEPAEIRTPKLGDEVTVLRGEISDWMIIERGELRGGYSIRLLRDRMSDADRRKLDDEVGLVITDQIAPD